MKFALQMWILLSGIFNSRHHHGRIWKYSNWTDYGCCCSPKCTIMIMQFIVKKSFPPFPKGSKFFIFLMRQQQYLNMRFGNSKRYHYKNTNNTIRESRKEISFHASFTPWPDVSERFITKQTKGDEWKIGNEALSRESCLIFNTTEFFSPFLINIMDFSQYFVTWRKNHREKEIVEK